MSVGDHPEKITFEDCVIRSASDKMLEFGPYAYSLDHIDVFFKNCDITFTGKSLIYMYAKTTAGSRVLFDECSIRSTSGTMVDGWSVDDKAYLDIVLRNTKTDKTLVTSTNIKSKNVKILVEEVNTPY